MSLRLAGLMFLALSLPSLAVAQDAGTPGNAAATEASADTGPDKPAPKLTKEEERRNRLAALTFAAEQAEQRGDVPTALAHYLRAITIEPNSAAYLTAAGRLALEQGDPKAAFGFLVRAASFSPRDEGVMVLLGRSLARDGRPRDALRIFERAIRLGADEADVASDRGFARDLMGEQRRAQRDYHIALARRPDDATTISRLGLSLAISGDRAAALSTLQPLASSSDGAAQRTLAFANALTGDSATAMTITQTAMPAATTGMARLVDALPHLNAEEKARAVHFGDLPSASAMAASKPSLASRILSVLRPEKPAEPATAARPSPSESRSAAALPASQPKADAAAAAPTATPPAKAQTPLDIALAACAEGAANARGRCEANAQALARRCADGRKTAECLTFARAEPPAAAPAKAQSPLDIALAKCASGRANARGRCEANARALAKRCASGRRTAECLDFRNASAPVAVAAATAKPATAPTPLEAALDACARGRASARRQCEVDARALARRCAGGRKTAECQAFASRTTAAEASTAPAAVAAASAASTAPSGNAPARPVDQVALICADASGSTRRQCEIDARALVQRCAGGRKTAECLALAELGETRGASTPQRATPAARARPAARVWVQVASGANRGDLPKEWQRLKKAHAAALRGQSPLVAANGRSNRLVIGPFNDQAAATAMVNRLRASGLSAFPWKSEVGEAVDALPGG